MAKKEVLKKANPAKPSKQRGIFFPLAGDENYLLGQEFIKNPKKFLKKYNLNENDLLCPDIAHKALERGEKFIEAVQKTVDYQNLIENIDTVKDIAATHLGKDYEVAMIPFGFKFREKLRLVSGTDITGTGTGSITFLDGDADVDG